jgi:hypothetical protein
MSIQIVAADKAIADRCWYYAHDLGAVVDLDELRSIEPQRARRHRCAPLIACAIATANTIHDATSGADCSYRVTQIRCFQSMIRSGRASPPTCKCEGLRRMNDEPHDAARLHHRSHLAPEMIRMRTQLQKKWAQQWFSGNAYCPQCRDGTSMTSVRRDGAGTRSIDTWRCGCGHAWKIELRQAAALVDARKNGPWIAREQPKPLWDAVLAATLCAELHTTAGASASFPDWALRANGEPNYEKIARRARLALRALRAGD